MLCGMHRGFRLGAVCKPQDCSHRPIRSNIPLPSHPLSVSRYATTFYFGDKEYDEGLTICEGC
jgi:hypothetical protein